MQGSVPAIALPGDAVNGLVFAEQRGGAVNADPA